MDSLLQFSLAIAAVAVVIIVAYVWWKLRKRGLSASDKHELEGMMARAAGQGDLHRRVMDCEKVLDTAFKRLGARGTFADNLKKMQARLGDREAVWRAHKLRNRIAHEAGIQSSAGDADSAVRAFSRALKDL